MTSRTLIIQTHEWRGLSASRDLFECSVTLGAITVMFSRRPLLDRLIVMLKLYKLMKSGGDGVKDNNFPEMSCADTDSGEQVNADYFAKFPKHKTYRRGEK